MRKLLCVVCVLWLVSTLSAQERRVEYDEKNNTVKITRIIPQHVPKHDFRLGVGTPSAASIAVMDGWGDDLEFDLRDEMANADTYLSDQRFTGAYSLSYTYHAKRWLQWGGTVGFAAAVRSRLANDTGEKVRSANQYMVAVMPTVRFVYLNREKVQLYSSISLGALYGTATGWMPWGDLTLFGCSFGRRLFGFAELGTGPFGWGRAGIGYRFEAGKK